MKLITVLTPCFNEELNVERVYNSVKTIFENFPQYKYKHLFVDNASTDQTIEKLKALARNDKRVLVIVNQRNFGAIRSGFHGLRQARGDAVICMACDLQDPPELLPEFISRWEQGEKLVVAVKINSHENPIVFLLRTMYYQILNRMANIKHIEHFTGFGLYDRSVVDELCKLDDTYPYFRELFSELGFKPSLVQFVQPIRKYGKSHTSLYDLYDLAMLGLTSHSRVPMRIATITGFFFAVLNFLISLFYLFYKLSHWNSFPVGIGPLVVGIFFMFSIQLMFIGLLGEYIGATHLQVLKRPLVVEKERMNFETLNEDTPGDEEEHLDR